MRESDVTALDGMVLVIAGSHRAGAKLERLCGAMQEFYSFHHDYHVHPIPADRAEEALRIKGVRRAPKKINLDEWARTISFH